MVCGGDKKRMKGFTSGLYDRRGCWKDAHRPVALGTAEQRDGAKQRYPSWIMSGAHVLRTHRRHRDEHGLRRPVLRGATRRLRHQSHGQTTRRTRLKERICRPVGREKMSPCWKKKAARYFQQIRQLHFIADHETAEKSWPFRNTISRAIHRLSIPPKD